MARTNKRKSQQGLPEGFDREAYDGQGGFGQVWVRVAEHLEMSPYAWGVYAAMCTFVQRKEGHEDQGFLFAFKKDIAYRAGGISLGVLDDAVKELKAKGLLTQERRWDRGREISSKWGLYDGPGQLLDVSAGGQGVTSNKGGGHSYQEGRSPVTGVGVTSDTGEGHPYHGHLEQTTSQTTRQTTGSDHSGTPTLAKASVGTSTESTKGDRAAVLAEKDKARENHTRSLAGTDLDPEPTWTLFLDAFTTRTEAEGTGWTIRDWVATKMKTTISRALEGYDRYQVDAAVVECARQARQPYLDSTLEGWITKALLGEASPEEREARFGTSAVDKAPVEPEPTVVIPEQRQATMDAKPRTETVEPVEVDVEDEDDIFLIRPEGLDDIEVQDDQEPEDDEEFRPMVNFETPEDEPLPVRFETPVITDVAEDETYAEWSARQAAKAPKSTTPRKPRQAKSEPVVDTFEGLPWGTDEEIVQAVWPDGVKTTDEYALAQRLDNWLVDFLISYRKANPDEEQTARMDKGITAVSRRVADLARTRAVKVEPEVRLDTIQALRARLREKVAA